MSLRRKEKGRGMYIASIALLVCSGVAYQLFQKFIAPSANPALSLLCSYITSLCLVGVLFILFPLKNTVSESIKSLNIYSVLLAFPIVGIELGYLLLYRAGGKLTFSSALVSSMITLGLVIIGIIVFKEKINVKKILGITFCISGIVLLNIK